MAGYTTDGEDGPTSPESPPPPPSWGRPPATEADPFGFVAPPSRPPVSEPPPYAPDVTRVDFTSYPPDATVVDLPPYAAPVPLPPAHDVESVPRFGLPPETETLPPLARRVSGPLPPRRSMRPRILMACGAGVALVALVVGGLAVLSAGKKTPPSASGPPALLAGSIFGLDPAAAHDGRDQELSSVASSGSTVVAAGGEFGTLNYRAEFLVSTDGGRSFRLASVRTSAGGEPPYGDTPHVIAGGSGGWAALGSSGGGTVAWTSTDGRSWIRQPPLTGSAFGPHDRIARLAATGSGFVAVGDTSAKGDLTDAAPVVWLSPDGRHWERIGADALNMSLHTPRLSLVDVAARGNTLITYGWSATGSRIDADGVWRSADDGRTWSKVDVPRPAGTAATGMCIAATPAGFLIARNAGRFKNNKVELYGMVLGSADGLGWAQIGEIDLPGMQVMRRLQGSTQGVAAVVSAGDKMLLARSPDGQAWQAAGSVSTPSGRDLTGLSVTGDATISTGRDNTGPDADAVLEVRDPHGQPIPVDLRAIPGAALRDQAVSDLAAYSGHVIAVGSADGAGAVWASSDGMQWTRGTVGGSAATHPAHQRLLSAAGGTAGWVAVGWDGVSPGRPLIVTSSDGLAWQSTGDISPFVPANGDPAAAFSVTSGPSGYVIAGQSGPSAATWQSTDLKSWQQGSGQLAGKPEAKQWMRGVTSGTFGYVAAGALEDPAVSVFRRRPAVWMSADGRKWTLQQLPLPQGTAEAWLDRVVSRGSTLVAAGTASTTWSGQRAFAFVSADGGKTWQEAPLPDTGPRPRYVLVTAATATPQGFVLAGPDRRDWQTDSDVVLWTSHDGRSWRLERPKGTGLSGPGDQWINGMAPFGSSLLAVGLTESYKGEQPTLWRRKLP